MSAVIDCFAVPPVPPGIRIAGCLGRRAKADDEVRLNQIQVIGTHNSYHVAPSPRSWR